MARVAAIVTVAALLSAGTAPAAAVPPAGVCGSAQPARPVVRDLPWSQQVLDPRRAWSYSTGQGVVVAVIDSGVDADHPQLRGKVLRGADYYQATQRGDFDCDSHGTAVASLIAAAPAAGVGFRGLAPDVRILPVRISDRAMTDGTSNDVDPLVLAKGIRYAVAKGARVINLSLAGTRDDPVVRNAIVFAQSYDVLVVAAAGNSQQPGGPSLPSYPAAYDGVLGVGAVDIDGARLGGSNLGSYVDLVAPGGGVLAATRQAGHNYWTGTSFAAPFVTATAALVRAAWPRLDADQVVERLVATASPARGGGHPDGYGAGIVDPYRAITEGLSTARQQELRSAQRPIPDPVVVAAAQARSALLSRSWFWAVLGLGAVLLIGLGAVVLPLGVRRRWASGRGRRPAAERAVDEPPDELFLIPPPPAER